MSEPLKKFLGDGPYPYPLKEFAEVVNIHSTDKFIVLEPKVPLDFVEESHAHESFEFFPGSRMPLAKVEKRLLQFEVNKLFVFNSEEFHGPATSFANCWFLAFQVDKFFMRETARMIYGREAVAFENGSFAFDDEIKDLIRRFVEENVNRQAGYKFIMETISTQVIIKLLRQLRSNMPALTRECEYKERNNINRAKDFLMEHYNDEYSLEKVAQIANLSNYHFIRVFKAQIGKTPYDYLLDIKIDKARAMLKDHNFSITDICFLCGFNSLNHFGSVFKRIVGVSPSYYRNSL